MQDRALNVTLLALAKNDQERWGSCVVYMKHNGGSRGWRTRLFEREEAVLHAMG